MASEIRFACLRYAEAVRDLQDLSLGDSCEKSLVYGWIELRAAEKWMDETVEKWMEKQDET